MSDETQAVQYFPILVSAYRFEEMAGSARREGCSAVVIMIPWAMIAPHEKQAVRNHSQTLVRLASRGGLNAAEAIAVLEDRPYQTMSFGASHTRLLAMHMEWATAQFLATRKHPTNPPALSE